MRKNTLVIIALLCAAVQGVWGQTTVDLSTITQNYIIADGATVTGTLGVNVDNPPKISIAAGATVTLSGIDINGVGEWKVDHAGLTCLGDATIILADGTTNTVRPLSANYSSIFVPKNYTLTIRGGGKLIADSRGSGGAGIGAGYDEDCGNIVIDGGIIEAYGSTAMYNTGVISAAIGGGCKGNCGNITITNNITSLYAWIEVVREGLFCIGSGLLSKSGTVTIGGQQLTFDGLSSEYGNNKGQVYDAHVSMYTNKIIYDSNDGTGTTDSQNIMKVITEHTSSYNPAISITSDNFERAGYALVKWNTRADGNGDDYKSGDVISQCWSTTPGDAMTLYAQWTTNEYYFDHSGKGNTADDPLEISTAEQLNLLATRVNAGNTYAGKYFKQVKDITFSTAGLGETESNFTAIGNSTYRFAGHFDGDGHTISGIRIYKGGPDSEATNNYQGLFGYIDTGAEVKNVILTDANITGNTFVGGIVGYNYNGTIDNCHVTSSVTIRAVANGAAYHGGIVGDNYSSSAVATVSNCTSAATLTIEGNLTKCSGYGAIAGYCDSYTTVDKAILRNNVAIGATVPACTATVGPVYGAVVGLKDDCILENNYYTACTVGGVANATGVGCSEYSSSSSTIHSDNGAVPALHNDADNTAAITLMGAMPEKTGTYKVCLNGRTFSKDGYWNTLCLPFDLDDFTGTPLEGATVMEFNYFDGGGSGFEKSTGTLTLKFDEVTEIVAGFPYIVRWGTPENHAGGNVENPVFPAVRVRDVNPDQRGARLRPIVRFGGTFKPVNIYTAANYKLYLGDDNKLYYPMTTDFEVKPFRSYFELLGDLYAGTSTDGVRTFVLHFGEDTNQSNGIVEAEANASLLTPHSSLSGWYTLDGRRLDGQPTQRGVYINKGSKVVIK